MIGWVLRALGWVALSLAVFLLGALVAILLLAFFFSTAFK